MDSTCPLTIRITKDRKTKFIFTGYYILEKDWNDSTSSVKKSHPNSVRLNNMIAQRIAEANGILLEMDVSDQNSTLSEIKAKISGSKKKQSFFQLAQERIDQYKLKGVFSVANAEQSIVNNIRKFTRGKETAFEDITQEFIEKFKVFCSYDLGQKSKRTITNQLIFIRTMFNIAIKNHVIDPKYYPFAGEKQKIKIDGGTKVGLSMEEVVQIENLNLEIDTQIWHARNIWLFAFYFAGIRISDVLKIKWSDIKDNRLVYVMNKNDKPVSLKVSEKINVVIKHYEREKKSKESFIFPYLKKADLLSKKDLFTKSRNASRLINKYLKRIAKECGIEKNLSNHIARHTFGNIAADRINPLMLQKLYRHSDLKTTINYQANFIHRDADDALDAVINS